MDSLEPLQGEEETWREKRENNSIIVHVVLQSKSPSLVLLQTLFHYVLGIWTLIRFVHFEICSAWSYNMHTI